MTAALKFNGCLLSQGFSQLGEIHTRGKIQAEGHNRHLAQLAQNANIRIIGFLFEICVGIILPMILFAYGIRNDKVGVVRLSAFLTVCGVVLNRLNTALITFNWKLPEREIPHIYEFVIALTVFAIYITVYRFILYRLPILYKWKTTEGDV